MLMTAQMARKRLAQAQVVEVEGPRRLSGKIELLIAEFYLVDRGLRHRLPGFSSMGRLVILP